MFEITPEGPDDGPEIDRLLDLAFGPDRRRKVSYRYRPGIAPAAGFCLAARDGEAGRLVGTIRYWPARLGRRPALLLGPLAIDPARRGEGIGRALTRASLGLAEAAGHRLVFLVGDPAYYARYGFEVVPPSIRVPDEDPGRVQYLTLGGADLPPEGGELMRADGRSVATDMAGRAGGAPAVLHPGPGLRRRASPAGLASRRPSSLRR